jgi:ABC-type dipeptide/oligopeptide/nickel transport system permease component
MRQGIDDFRNRPLGELMRDLVQDVNTLIHEEIELAKAELTQKARQAGVGAGMFIGAGVAGIMALGALTASTIAVIAIVLPVWVAALMIALVWGVIAGLLAMSGRTKVRQATPATPQQAIDTTKEDLRWAKTRMKSGRR